MKTMMKFLHVQVCLAFSVMLFFGTSTSTAQSDQPNYRSETRALTSSLNHPNSAKSSPNTNLLLLFNCSIGEEVIPLYIQNNCTVFHTCGAVPAGSLSIKIDEEKAKISPHQCLLVEVNNLSVFGFRPKDLNCSHYLWVHKARSSPDEQGYEMEMKVSFDIHLPDICKKCEKPNGNCGVALRCICHPKQCKEKVISEGSSLKSTISHISFSVLSSLFLTGSISFNDYVSWFAK